MEMEMAEEEINLDLLKKYIHFARSKISPRLNE